MKEKTETPAEEGNTTFDGEGFSPFSVLRLGAALYFILPKARA